MCSGKAKWISIDEFVSIMEEHGVDISIVQLLIDNRDITIKHDKDILVAMDYKYNALLYKILSGNINTKQVTSFIGKHFRTVNRNTIRVHEGKYVVYTLDGKVRTFRKADRAIEYANKYDLYVYNSSNSQTVRLNKQDITKLKGMLKIAGYQGKINNKLNKTLGRINVRDKYRNDTTYDSWNNNSDISDRTKVPIKYTRTKNKKDADIHNNNNHGSHTNMEHIGRKKRTIKVSKQTREYISNKYDIPVNKLTYLMNYTRDTNIKAMEIISDAIDYENNVVHKKITELNEAVYGISN